MSKYQRFHVVHVSVVAVTLVLACLVMYFMWSYTPETPFGPTLESEFIVPVFRPLFSVLSVGAVLLVLFDRRTSRLRRMLRSEVR